jgi:hypothetical protein
MRSSQRLALLVGAAVVLVIGFVIANSGGTTKSSAPTTRHFHVTVAGGKPVGGIAQLSANKGDTIDLTISSDRTEPLHVHGYDIHKTVAANGTATFNFKATIDGTCVIELESTSVQIASLTVKL